MIRSSKHSIKDMTSSKQENYALFIKLYRQEMQICIDYLWNTKIEWKDKDGNIRVLDVKNNQLDCPKWLSTVGIQPNGSPLYARVWKCLMTQCLGIVKSATKQRNNLLFVRQMLIKDGKNVNHINKKLKKVKVYKPSVNLINPELNSICADFFDQKELSRERKSNISHFDGFLRLKCLGPELDDILIPIKFHKASNKFMSQNFEMMTSFSISDNHVEIRWQKKADPKKTTGQIVGADQGRVNAVTFSDGQQISKNPQGQSLNDIVIFLGRAKPGSKRFKRLQTQQKNFIGWAVNQLDLLDIQEIHLEKIFQMGKISFHWYYPLILRRIQDRTEEESVTLTLQSSRHRSQRCNSCGYVHRTNRNGDRFLCKACGFAEQSDLNAAKNHISPLARLTKKMLEERGLDSRKGFYWLDQGIFDVKSWREQGDDLSSLDIVPATSKRKISKR